MYTSNRNDISKPFYAINEVEENVRDIDTRGVTIETYVPTTLGSHVMGN